MVQRLAWDERKAEAFDGRYLAARMAEEVKQSRASSAGKSAAAEQERTVEEVAVESSTCSWRTRCFLCFGSQCMDYKD